MTQPLGYIIDNLRPFDVPVYVNSLLHIRFLKIIVSRLFSAAAVDFVGLIYLLILSFIIAVS